MTKKAPEPAVQKKAEPPSIGFFLELEFMLFPGRRMLFEAYAGVLKKHQISMDARLFARYCLKRNIENNLKTLLTALDKKGVSETELAAKIREQFELSLKAGDTGPVSEILHLLEKIVQLNIKIGLLSYLPGETAELLMARFPLSQPVRLQAVQKEADDLPTPDGWLSLMKVMEIPSRRGLALVNSAQACKSALAVGMRCIVLPDIYSDWQDFGGADIVLDNISDLKPNDVMSLLTPAHLGKRVKK
jgi:beta-phosphoglucomutase-like phosphatase (HAD superfamily)